MTSVQMDAATSVQTKMRLDERGSSSEHSGQRKCKAWGPRMSRISECCWPAIECVLWEAASAEASGDGHQLPGWQRGREEDVQSNPRQALRGEGAPTMSLELRMLEWGPGA